MTLTMAPELDEDLFEALIDLENLTWTCVEHGTVNSIASGAECPDCTKRSGAPPDKLTLRRLAHGLIS